MKKLLFLVALVAIFAACEKNSDSISEKKSTPMETITAIDITTNSALLIGRVSEEIANNKSIKYGMLISEKESDVLSYEGKKLVGDTLLGQTFSITATGLSAETKYYYRAYLILNSMHPEYGAIKSFMAEESGVENNHQYVDLGLSVKWATCNVGASKPEEYGDYFAWGETKPYYADTTITPITWKSGKETGYDWLSYCGNDNFVEWSTPLYDASTKILKQEYDAAHVNWGGNWRMPTKTEQDELRTECNWIWIENYNNKGVSGYIVSSKLNSNSIFLPASGERIRLKLYYVNIFGFYWSSSLYKNIPSSACSLFYDSDYTDWYYYGRYSGHSVRPVCQ